MLGQLEAGDRVVVADFEAGLGTLSRMKAGQLDVLLVVTEPTVKALEVARRAVELIRERSVAEVVVLANRATGPEDRTLVEQTFAGGRVVFVPDDPAIRAADARGVAPYDSAPDAPAVRVLRTLSESLAA